MRARLDTPPLRLAIVGGGLGIGGPALAQVLAPHQGPPAFDVAVEDGPGAAALGAAVRAAGCPVQVLERAAALEGAALVLCPPRPSAEADALWTTAGWPDAPPVGPPALMRTILSGPAVMELARQVTKRAPDALLVLTGQLSDVLAGAARRRFGVGGLRPVGLGVHLAALRLRLAELFGAAPERVALVHGGVHGVGWILRFAVDGRDGYGELPSHIGQDAVLEEVWRLTGLIPTVPEGGWPWGAEAPSPESAWQLALRRLLRAVASGEPDVVGLDVPFSGEALSWPAEVTAEVPAVVVGTHVDPVAVGPLPPAADGLPRMLALQRGLASDYLASPDPAVLLRALAATPQWGSPSAWRRLTVSLEAVLGTTLEHAVRP